MALFPSIAQSPAEVRDALRPLRRDFSVALHTLHNAFAVGAIIRTAHSFLAREIVLVGSEPFYEKASMGMEKYEDVVRVGGEDDLFARARAEGRPVFAVERDHARRSLYDAAPFPEGVVFLFGSERAGLPESALVRADDVVGIPMYGVNHSFPVAVAAGIVMGEWARRHFGEGRIL